MQKKAKILVLFYSTYGHVYQLAKAAAEGAQSAGAEVSLKRVEETLSDDILGKLNALEARKSWAHIPIVDRDELPNYDAFLIGTPTRFGNMSAQMKNFVDSLGGLWVKNSLVGKPASFFTSTSSQHGGTEVTIITSMIPWLHLGCIIVGLPYKYQNLVEMNEIIGSSPYGAATISGIKNERKVSQIDLGAAKFQGEYVAQIAAKLIQEKQ